MTSLYIYFRYRNNFVGDGKYFFDNNRKFQNQEVKKQISIQNDYKSALFIEISDIKQKTIDTNGIYVATFIS